VEASGRSERFPARVTTPVENPGQSALADVEEGERERAIGPTTEPAEPLGQPQADSPNDAP